MTQHCGYSQKTHSFSFFLDSAEAQLPGNFGQEASQPKAVALLHSCLRIALYWEDITRAVTGVTQVESDYRSTPQPPVQALQAAYFRNFPSNAFALKQEEETKTAIFSQRLLTEKLSKLNQGNRAIKSRYGGDYVARRPTSKVRESEIVLMVGLLRGLGEAVLMIAGNADIFEKVEDWRGGGGTNLGGVSGGSLGTNMEAGGGLGTNMEAGSQAYGQQYSQSTYGGGY